MSDSEHELDPQEVERLVREESWELIDVRDPDEREATRIAGTRHVEMNELAAQAETIDRERAVVFYCRTGARSGMAAEAFRTAGYDAHNMRGGIEAWVAAGLPVED